MTFIEDELNFDPIAYLNAERWRNVSLGLVRIQKLLEYLGSPQEKFKSVHVAGTNGKGSTCAYLASIFHLSKLKCGLFTSPYIEQFEERISISGEMINSESLRKITLLVKDAARKVEFDTGEHPTEFELMFAVACVYFAEENCDVCVIECGLGGRLDATNVIVPSLSVITPISLDHTDILGDSIEAIAREKAGIIKEGIACVSAMQDLSAINVIEQTCQSKNSSLTVIDPAEISDISIDLNDFEQLFSYEGLVNNPHFNLLR